MVFIRPVTLADLDGLEELAALAGAGLTTLPKDRDLLRKRIGRSQRSFTEIPDRPGGEAYLFVMEDGLNGHVVGTCGIAAKVGGFEPFYSYKVETQLFESDVIHIRKEVPLLRLHEDHNGPAEIGSLFLHPDYRGGGNGRVLQLVRFLFIAEFRHAFETQVVSEIRGVSDAAGQSPFWDAIGRHFFGIDFVEADRLSVVNKKFIADLMPDHPVYIPILPRSAQAVIGVPHEHSRPAMKNLEREGFRFGQMVDIFDAGPVLVAPRDDIRTVRESRRATVVRLVPDRELTGPAHLVSTTRADFRACHVPVQLEGDDGIRLPLGCADVLNVKEGELVRHVPLYSGERQGDSSGAQGGGPP